MTVYLCPNCLDGILCGVYDAWMSGRGHDHVRLQLEHCGNREMFCQYERTEVTGEKVEKVAGSIRTKISEEAYETVCEAALSHEEERADRIYRFLILGFHYGRSVISMLQIPAVYEIFRMTRQVANEAHLLRGFVRFSQMEEGVLAGRIRPRCDVLPLLAPFFADRLSGETWILYDEGRQKAALHPADGRWFLMDLDHGGWNEAFRLSEEEEEYRRLWRAFHRSISIRERENPRCQRSNLPLHFRTHMPEFMKQKP